MIINNPSWSDPAKTPQSYDYYLYLHHVATIILVKILRKAHF